eukprot:TRINITY_DN12990_c0_g1_i1.p1 TRINITY_DN12990_c0_g1~~TRINITY_DN12990_c0_g1_i1.p1  ORF type:complete len:471 (+),score=57.00 TRINITY_DN12990_c0_g1_i1:75-1415(+)
MKTALILGLVSSAITCPIDITVVPGKSCTGSLIPVDVSIVDRCKNELCSKMASWSTATVGQGINLVKTSSGCSVDRPGAVEAGHVFCTPGSASSFRASDEVWPAPDGSLIQLKRLTSIVTNDSVLVATSNGGRIEHLQLMSKGHGLIDMLAGNNKNASAMQDRNNYRGCSLMPWANRIENGEYTSYGSHHKLPINENHGVRHHAMHGFMFFQNMTAGSKVTESANQITLTITKSFNENSYPGYPFSFDVTIEYTLNSSSHLSVKASATNTHSHTAMPFYMGWHPFFKVKDVASTCIEFDYSQDAYDVLDCGGPPFGDQLIANASLIPTGKAEAWTQFDGKTPIGLKQGSTKLPNYYDTAFRIRNSKLGITRNKINDGCKSPYKMVLWQDDKFRFNQLYTGLPSSTGEEAIAFEPQSGSTNAYNNGDDLSVLYPGQTFHGQFGFYIE